MQQELSIIWGVYATVGPFRGCRIDPNKTIPVYSQLKQRQRTTLIPSASQILLITKMFMSRRSINLQQCAFPRRGLATAALSRFEPEKRVDFGKFTSKIGTLRER